MKLYKIDTKGKLRFLEIIATGNILTQISGLVNGKEVTHSKEIKEKNIGRANYLTAEQSCDIEKEALIKLKIREGYSTSEREAFENNIIKPTLAKDFKEFKDNIDFETSYIQRKYDGMRCLAELDGKGGVILRSRTQKEIETVPHIIEALQSYRGIPIILDGELYAEGLDFQTNMSLIKKYKEGQSNLYIKYYVYDTVDEQPFWIRVKRTGFFNDNILPVETFRVNNLEDIEKYHTKFISEGYEGSIIRHGNSGYIQKRTDKLLKKKDFIDMIASIVDIEPSDAYPEQGIFVLEGLEGVSKGKTFKAQYKGNFEQRTEILTNKDNYIGKVGEIRFFEYSNLGVPRFPVLYGFRLDK